MQAGGRVDTGNPKTTKITLSIAPVAVCVCLGAVHRLPGSPEQTPSGTKVPLGLFQDLFSPPSGCDAVLGAGHGLLHSQGAPDVGAVGSGDCEVLPQFPLSLRRSLAQHMGAICLLPFQIGAAASLETLAGRPVCLELGHFAGVWRLGKSQNIQSCRSPGKDSRGGTASAANLVPETMQRFSRFPTVVGAMLSGGNRRPGLRAVPAPEAARKPSPAAD